MQNIDENIITPAVLESFAECRSPRLKQVLSALVRHLHDFAREVRLTEAEWAEGIDFLTKTGQMCNDKRQEFILLSDTLGLSMLTVAMNHPASEQATESTVFGPFHTEGAPAKELGEDISGGASGEPLLVQATVKGPKGEPVAGAEVDVWQADDEGLYDVQRTDLPNPQNRAVLHTDKEGRLWFRTVLPVAYPIPTDGPVGRMLDATGRHPWRPGHVHFMIKAPGYQTLVTHVFRSDDKWLDSDAVFGVRSSLIGHFEAHPPGRAPDGRTEPGPFHTLAFDFVMEPAAKV